MIVTFVISVMLALNGLAGVIQDVAAPTAGGNFSVRCATPPPGELWDGIAVNDRVRLAPWVCRAVGRLAEHRGNVYDTWGVRVLLHEARHVWQFRTDWKGQRPELDAECAAVRDLPRALRALGYRRGFIRQAVSLARDEVRHTPPPYGGRCA